MTNLICITSTCEDVFYLIYFADFLGMELLGKEVKECYILPQLSLLKKIIIIDPII